MSLTDRIRQLFRGDATPTRPTTVLVEFLADRGRLEQAIEALRAQAVTGDAQHRQALADLAERLAAAGDAIQSALAVSAKEIKADLAESKSVLLEDLAAATAGVKDDLARTEAALVERLDGLAREVGKLGREQFRATTLLDGQGTTLDELADAWRESVGQREREAADHQQALGCLESQVRLGMARDLLPVADALGESIQAARELLSRIPAESRSLPQPRPPSRAGLLARLFGIEAVEPVAPVSMGEHRVAFDSWLEGLLLVERRLLALLEREGIQPIPAVGRPFDPDRHVAVAVEPSAAGPDGTVVREERRGYTVGDRVLRHAEVVVARREADMDLSDADSAHSHSTQVQETGGLRQS